MILALDVGNSNIVVGCLDSENIFLECRLSTDKNKTAAEYAVILKNLLDIYDVNCNNITGTIISSVVPSVTVALKNALFAVTGYMPIEVNVHSKHGLKILIDNPEELGNDLIVGAVAALEKFKPPLILFDLGTATTVSYIDKDKNFLGVSILPGIVTAMKALFSNTAQLPEIKIEAPKKVICKSNTVESMQSGAVFGNASMMDGMIDRINEEMKSDATVVATGGLAKALIPYCKHKIICDDDLLLEGLYILYERNK